MKTPIRAASQNVAQRFPAVAAPFPNHNSQAFGNLSGTTVFGQVALVGKNTNSRLCIKMAQVFR